MSHRQPTAQSLTLVAVLLLAAGAMAAPTQLSNTPMSGATAADIAPNITFVLDDSGSMDWEYLPDWADVTEISQSRNASFNGVAYNPAFTYLPPKYLNASGQDDTTTYPTQNSANTSAWTSVKDDGYGRQSTSRSNLVGAAYYFLTVPGEYCTDERLKVCNAQSAPSTQYPVPAKLRWCSTAADAVAAVPSAGACQATQIDPTYSGGNLTNFPFNYPRMPAPRTSTLSISGSSYTSVTSITVGGSNILSAATSSTSTPSTLASRIASNINDCTLGLTGNCQVIGYRAAASGSTVTIYAPGVTTATPAIAQSASMTIAATAFDRPSSNLAPGENLLIPINANVTQPARALTRTDCAADPCTYTEEMTNYANWWAYYRSRMQTMKTAASLAFNSVSTSFRVGYMSINNNTGTDFQNLGPFTGAQKKAWYDKLFAAVPSNYTPLRAALSNAGRLYAGRLNGTTFNGVSVVDPVQFYCQSNVTILSTDGYWNRGAGFMWNGTTAVGDQDGPGLEVRPQLDGGGYNVEKTTRQITETLTPTLPTQTATRTAQLESQTSQLLQLDGWWIRETSEPRISTLTQLQTRNVLAIETRTSQLQKRTLTQQQESTAQLQSRTAQAIQQQTANLQESVEQVQRRDYSNGLPNQWQNVTSCTFNRRGNNRVDCQRLAATPWTTVSGSPQSCTVVTTADVMDRNDATQINTMTTRRACRYDAWSSWTNVGSCTAVAQSPGPTNYTGPAINCQTVWPTAWTNVSSCTASTTVQCRYDAWSSWADVASCTTVAQSAGPSYNHTSTGGLTRQCQTVWTPWANTASSCTSSATTQCQYAPWSTWATVGSCTPNLASTSSPYTVTLARECQTTYSAWTNASGPCPPTNTQTQQCTWTTPTLPSPLRCTPSATTQCTYTAYATDPTPPPSCTAVSQDWTNFSRIAVQCNVGWPAAWVPSSSCTTSTTQRCSYAAWSSWGTHPGSSCTTQAQCGGPSYQPPCDVARQCRQTAWSAWTSASPATTSCTAGTTTSNTGAVTQTQCSVPPPTSSFVASCTPEPASAANGWVARTCSTATTGPTLVNSCIPAAPTAANNFIETTCTPISLGATPDTLADVAEYYWKTDLRDPALLPDRCTGGPVVTGGVTVYNNVCTNDARYPRQYMSTYTLGLGASGLMQYRQDYDTATRGDFYSVKTGQAVDQTAGVCSWQTTGPCNWPMPASDSQANIDDLWHAAVNGRGIYFSATDPGSLASALSGALSAISARAGAVASVAVTSPNLTGGTGEFFEVSFRTGEWSGDVARRRMGTTLVRNPTTGQDELRLQVLAQDPTQGDWSAQAQLDTLVSNSGHTGRTIYAYNPPGTTRGTGCPGASADNLKPFLWAQLCAAEQAYFTTPAIASLTQFCGFGSTCLSSATQTLASGEPLVDFLRGDRTNEGPLGNLATYYRQRTHILGDIVGSEATYVKGSPWNYADYNYSTFKAANQSRAAMVYVAANDGMLHAFDASTGNELWAYVPSLVMSRLYKLADKNYGAQGMHQFTVDGTPVAGDICASDCVAPASGSLPTVWKTILVGGLNNGGRGYYALDVTDPANPKALWEFTDSNLGYTYGNPVITKLKDGTWVVIITSGYNNIGPGDGRGYLYVLNANTGAVIRTISTGVGDTTTPSGLARISGWVNLPENNNTTLRVYGGDQFGNVWRFDINGDIPAPAVPPASPVYDAQRLAALKDPSGNAQPITTAPEITLVRNRPAGSPTYPALFVTTGQYLGTDDMSSTQTQSIYAIKDRLVDLDYGNPRTATGSDAFVAQTLSCTTNPCTQPPAYTATRNAVDWNNNGGWYVDFTIGGERVNTDLRLALGTLSFVTNRPRQNDPCVQGGDSTLYTIDYRTGGAVVIDPISGTTALAGVGLGPSLSTSPTIVRLVDGTIWGLVRDDSPQTQARKLDTEPTPLDTRRVSWRELITE